MTHIIRFFLSLRPIWTRRGLEVVWYTYVLWTLTKWFILSPLLPFHDYYVPLLSPQFIGWPGYSLSLIHAVLFDLAALALVRIFLELALRFLAVTEEGRT